MTSTTTQKIEGSLFPQTTSTYRCVNNICQAEKIKQVEDRAKLIKEKKLAIAFRDEKKLQNKIALKKGTDISF